jgi:DHA2 family multidrug resistance protein
MRNAAGLYNLTRDLGGAIGLATIVTIMNERLHFHWNRLIEDINPARASVQQFLDLQVHRFDPLIGDPSHAAMKMLADLVRREALVLTYNDLLLLIGSLFIFGLMLIPLVGRPRSFLSH